MSKDNTTTTTVELPPELKAAAIENLELGDAIGGIGYVPYTGNTVAGLTPQQMSAMQGSDQAAAAFGAPSNVDWDTSGGGMAAPEGMSQDDIYTALTGMPPPTADASGMMGYSPMSRYEEALDNMAPGQRAMIDSFVMDPVTGDPPTNPAVPDRGFNPIIPEEYARTEKEKKALRKANRKEKKRRKDQKKKAAAATIMDTPTIGTDAAMFGYGGEVY